MRIVPSGFRSLIPPIVLLDASMMATPAKALATALVPLMSVPM